jgi:2-C-methyl-D-erythritol 4-phosphate cytidylyltransferase
MEKYVIIVAGGKGLRMGMDVPKQFLLINEKPVLMHTIKAFYDYDPEIQIILVLPKERQFYWRMLCRQYKFRIKHKVADSGETRFHSVKNGLGYIKKKKSLVAIHDGVRPLVSQELIAEAFETAKNYDSAYPVIPITDSMRKLLAGGKTAQEDRSRYLLIQTPQVFVSEMIISAYEQDYSEKFTDDISVFETQKHNIPHMIDGSTENIKITTPMDLVVAEVILNERSIENNEWIVGGSDRMPVVVVKNKQPIIRVKSQVNSRKRKTFD